MGRIIPYNILWKIKNDWKHQPAGLFNTARLVPWYNIYYIIYIIIDINYIWLVVSTPLKNISQLGWLFPIYGKVKNVPNHQPELHLFMVSKSTSYHADAGQKATKAFTSNTTPMMTSNGPQHCNSCSVRNIGDMLSALVKTS